jgi:hypothetical protein
MKGKKNTQDETTPVININNLTLAEEDLKEQKIQSSPSRRGEKDTAQFKAKSPTKKEE